MQIPPVTPRRWWRRWLRRLVGSCVILGAILYPVWISENRRGKQVWESLVLEYAQRGEPLVFAEWLKLRGGSLGSESNFWNTPLWRPLTGGDAGDAGKEQVLANDPVRNMDVGRIRLPALVPSPGRVAAAQLDLARWQESFRASGEFANSNQLGTPASGILQALSRWKPQLDELRSAARRPERLLPLRDAGDTTALSDPVSRVALRLSEVVTLESVAQLELGDTRLARENLELNETLGEAVLPCGALGQHVGERILGNSVRIIYEGLCRHRWDEADLIALARILAARDYRRGWSQAIGWQRQELVRETMRWFDRPRSGASELSQFGQVLASQFKVVFTRTGRLFSGRESVARYGNTLFTATVAAIEGLGDLIAAEAFAHTPGWRYQNMVLLVRDMDADLSDQQRWARGELTYDRKFIRATYRFPPWWNVYRRWPGPPAGRPVSYVAAVGGEGLTHMAQIAVALERYRIRHGDYPATLNALLPGDLPAIPLDPLTGTNYLFTPGHKDRYRLDSSYVKQGGDTFMTEWPQPDSTNAWSRYSIGVERGAKASGPGPGW